MSDYFCPRCNTEHRPASKFCTECNFPLETETASGPSLAGKRWLPRANEFATRIEASQLGGWIRKGLEVEQNQTGLLFRQGRFVQEIGPGPVQLKNFSDMIVDLIDRKSVSAILIRSGMFPFDVQGRALTKGAIEVGFECSISVQLGDRNRFYENLFVDQVRITQREIMEKLGPTVRQAVLEVMANCEAAELMAVHPELRERFIDAIEDALVEVADRYGLKVTAIVPPQFTSAHLKEFNRKRAEITQQLRERKLDLKAQELQQELEVESYRLNRQLSRTEMRDKIAQLEQDQEFEQVKKTLEHETSINDLDLKKTLERAVDGYEKELRERNHGNQLEQEKIEDHQNLRAHLLATIEVQRQIDRSALDYQLQKQVLEQNQDLSQLERTNRLQALDEELESEQQRLNKTTDYKIARWEKVQHSQWEFAQKKFYDRVEMDLKKAQTDQEIQRGEIDLEAYETARRLEGDAATDEVKGKRLRTKMEIQREHLEGLTDIDRKKGEYEDDKLDREHRRKIEEAKLQQELELRKAELDLQKSDLARLADTNPETAALMADVLKTGMKVQMTAEQLEQLAAESSDAAAAALAEKHKANAAAQTSAEKDRLELYERMISEIKESKGLDRQQLTDLIDRIERSGTTGQQLLRDVGIASSRPNEVNTTVQGNSDETLDKLTKQLKRLVDQLKNG